MDKTKEQKENNQTTLATGPQSLTVKSALIDENGVHSNSARCRNRTLEQHAHAVRQFTVFNKTFNRTLCFENGCF